MSKRKWVAPVIAIILAAACLAICRTAAEATSSAAYTWKSVEIGGGGFVDGIVCDPHAKDVIYARTDVGGAYRWNQATNSWEQMFDWVPSSLGNAVGIESVAIDPRNSDVVYAVGGYSGPGTFFASQNRGHTWTATPLPFDCGSNNSGRQIGERLAVDPNDPSVLYYGSIQNGLYRSSDYGSTWTQVTSFPVTSTSDGAGISFVEFVPSSGTAGNPTKHIFVGVSQTGNNLYESKDAGSTWAPVYSSSTLMPARAALDGMGNMYMAYDNAAGPNGISAGAIVKLSLKTLAASTVLSTPSGWQYGYGSVSVSAQNRNEVIASTIDRWWPHDGLYLSTDGGSTWTDTSTNANVDDSLSPYIGTYDPLGSWDGSAQIDPFDSSRVFFGTGGGTTIVTNLTSSSPTYTFNSDGIEEMVPLGLGCPSTGSLLYMVFGDIGGFADTNITASPTASQHFSVGGTIRGLDYAEDNPSELAILPDTVPTEGAFSTNAGSSWTDFPSSPPGFPQYWEGSIAVSAKGDYMVWTPGADTQYYSTNDGATWTKSVGGTSYASWYTCPAVSDRVVDGDFYAYDFTSGDTFRSTDGGATFSVVATGLPTWCAHDLVAVPGIAGDLWLATSYGLYHSTDFGSHWTEVNTGYIVSMGFGKAAPGSAYPTIFAHGTLSSGASPGGIYMSTDEGVNWTEIDDPFDQWGGGPGIVVGDPNSFGRVYVGCGGLGVFYGDIAPNMPVSGVYAITNRLSGMALDNQSSMAGGAAVVQEPASGAASQQWQVVNLGNGQVKIISSYSGMALSVIHDSNGSGARIVQSPWANSPYQTWTVTLNSSGYDVLTSAGSGLALSDTMGSKTAGTVQTQAKVNGGERQQWSF